MKTNKKINRRNFILISTVTAGVMACEACQLKKNNNPGGISGHAGRSMQDEAKDMNESMSRDEIMRMLDHRVDNYMSISHHCAQTSFLALSEQFGFENQDIVKSLTPLPGIAETGQTCGVVIGSLIVMGLIFGRDRIDDWEKYRSSLKPAGLFVNKFKAEYGSLMCGDIIEKEFGMKFDLLDPVQHQEFVAADATSKCSAVSREGVRIAAGIILDEGLK